ncbi:MAG: hypothetical protein EBQ92_13800 [Proteobacteria bacterium]|nr:hypothetical protein [Pseudomonadota bacterium]
MTKLTTTLDDASKWLEDNQSASKEEYDEKQKELESVFNPYASQMYGSNPMGSGPMGNMDMNSVEEMMKNMSPEQMAQMQEMMKNMTPEQMAEMQNMAGEMGDMGSGRVEEVD